MILLKVLLIEASMVRGCVPTVFAGGGFDSVRQETCFFFCTFVAHVVICRVAISVIHVRVIRQCDSLSRKTLLGVMVVSYDDVDGFMTDSESGSTDSSVATPDPATGI